MSKLVNQRVHVIGVGGAGMSGLARYLHERGITVSGSDHRHSEETDQLVELGIPVQIGHDLQLVSGATVVTFSPAVPESDPERRWASEHARTCLTRSEMLAEVAREHHVVALAGTHGKTTSTSMMIHVMLAAGLNPSWLLGASVEGAGANGHHAGANLVLELDESFGTFATMAPHALGVLNIEADHLDHYGTVENLEAAFVELASRVHGPVVTWVPSRAYDVLRQAGIPVLAVGPDARAEWIVTDVATTATGSSFVLEGTSRCHVRLAVPGMHNVENAAVVAALALAEGLDVVSVERGLERFTGAPRRYQIHGRCRGALVIEDYAHLPSELATTIATACRQGTARVVAVFQPHRVTRTEALAPAFGTAFDGVDELIVTDVYTSGEPNPRGVTGALIADEVRARGSVPKVHYVADLAEAEALARTLAPEFDCLLILGAGDVGELARRLVDGAGDVS